jgi:glycosyltransferase involved in cell wall biosynthesis
MPLVSVLLAVHNDEAFVRAAVESTLRQTLGDLELIVIDDASTDATPALLSDLSDDRVAVITNNEQLGLAASLNRGLERARGRYVARLDADDVAFPERLEVQVARLAGDARVAIVGSAVLDIDEQGRPGTLHRAPMSPRAVRWLALFSSPFFHPTIIVDRDQLAAHDLSYDASYLESEDYDLWTRLFEFGEGANVGEPLVLKRVHAQQASQRRGELQQSFQQEIALRQLAAIAPELSSMEAEGAWAVGSGRGRGDPEAFQRVLSVFERRHGIDAEVRELAARALLAAGAKGRALALGVAPLARLAARSVQRRASERVVHRRARSWLTDLDGASAAARVVFVSPEPTPYRAPLLDRIAAHPEVDLTVVYAARTVAGRTWSVDLKHQATYLNGLRVPGLQRVFRHDYPLTPGIRRALSRAHPDLVVVSGWSTFASQAGTAWARAHRVPIALLVESHDLGPRAGWRRRVKRAVVPAMVRAADTYLVVGSLARESLVSYGAPVRRVRVFANTVDVDAWARRATELRDRRADLRASLGVEQEDVVVLSVARLVRDKGLETLVRGAAATGDQRLAIAVAGSGPQKRELERRSDELGVRLYLLGDLSQEAVAEAYVAADVFALLSLHEPWGVVVNEAAASGLPLVLSDRVGAAYDLLRDGENGFLVPAEDVAATAAALQRLANDPALRQRAGSRSQELVAGWGYGPSVENFLAAVREATAR